MLFSIVIPTYRREAELQRCLRQIAAFLPAGDEAEIIISDDSLEECKDKGCLGGTNALRIQGPKKGPAANRNHGASLAKGDWLIFLDDDCIPDCNLLTAYSKALEEHADIRVIEGRITSSEPQTRMDEIAPLNEKGGFLWSCNFAIRKDLFVSLGGFCEKFPYAAMEDVDLRERLAKMGEKVVFARDAFVIHPWRLFPEPTSFAHQMFHSHRIFFSRHPNFRPTLFQVVRSIAREFYDGLFRMGPRLKFRGFYHWFLVKTMDCAYRLRHASLFNDEDASQNLELLHSAPQER